LFYKHACIANTADIHMCECGPVCVCIATLLCEVFEVMGKG